MTLEFAQAERADVRAGHNPSPPLPPQLASPLTIVHVITRLLLSGAEENTVATCLHQARCGHRVILLHGPGADPSWERRHGDLIEFITVDSMVHPLSPLADLSAVAECRRLYRMLRPDVVHTHGSKAGIVGRLAAASGVRLVVHSIHIAPFLAVSREKRLVYIAAERLCARLTHLFIAVSRGMQQAFIDEGIGNAVPIPVVHSGMPIDRFIGAPPPRDWRNRIGGWSGTRRPQFILKVASFEPRKRQIALIRAMAAGLRARADVCLLLAGDGPERERCKQEVDALGLNNQVRFLGHDARPWELVALADVAVHAAEREGLPRTAIQAIAGGKPLVICSLPGIDEIIEHGTNGLVTDPDDLDHLASELFSLLDNPDRLLAMKRAAASTDVSSWAEHRMGSRIDSAYAGALTPGISRGQITAIEFLGLPGAGKTTIARELRPLLRNQRGGVRFSGAVMGDDLPLWHRSLRRLAMIGKAFAWRPWRPLAASRGMTRGAANLRDKTKTRWNFWSVLAMQAGTDARTLLVNDQGLAQALWSAQVYHRTGGEIARRLLNPTLGWVEHTLFVHVATPAPEASHRLSLRARLTSRFQRLDGRDEGAMWENGQIAMDSVVRELESALGQAGLGDRLLRIDADKVSARRAAAVIAETLALLEKRTGSND